MRSKSFLSALVVLSACSDSPGSSQGEADGSPTAGDSAGTAGGSGSDGDGDAGEGETGSEPSFMCTEEFTEYVGMNGTDLASSRLDLEPGTNRARMLPFKRLREKYKRVLDVIPGFTGYQDISFYEPVIRWFVEPEINAINVLISFRSGYQGCRAYLSGEEFGIAPTPATAEEQCIAWQRRFWSVEPTSEQTASCVSVLLHPQNTDPVVKNRWAYGCASVISATQFLTY